MAKILMLEKYKGELNGEHTSIYIATDVNFNTYKSYDLKLKQVGKDIVNDIKNTKWIKINESEYNSIKSNLRAVSSVNYLARKENKKHRTPKRNYR